MTASHFMPAAVQALADERSARVRAACAQAGVPFGHSGPQYERLRLVLAASDFAFALLLRRPQLLDARGLARLDDPSLADRRVDRLHPAIGDETFATRMRRFRQKEALRLVWRDVAGLDGLEQTLAGSTVLAETCLQAALWHVEQLMSARHGEVRAADGSVQRLVVIALGKLGGCELNFSSDIDLILAWPQDGVSDGPRPLDAATWFDRAAQALNALLSDVGEDGQAFRVDLRLRPYGSVGRLAMSFTAMEQYYQREGRDWERYAWVKARPVAGDMAAGWRLLDMMRPFIYRRYLDYGAISGLRQMKALINAEVARRDLADHIKLGVGGIREIEFTVQLVQMIRGGRESALRVTGLLPALDACQAAGFVSATTASCLRAAYRFLRLLENRLQMLGDRQTHDLPADGLVRARLAYTLGFPGWPALADELARHRRHVREEFAALLSNDGHDLPPWTILWEQLQHDDDGQLAARMGLPPGASAQIRKLLGATSIRRMSTRSRERFDAAMPAILAATAASRDPGVCLERMLALVQAVARRSVYLALLAEQPAALRRLGELFSDSALLSARLLGHPLLLDELFDSRASRMAQGAGLARRMAHLPDSTASGNMEAELESLAEEKMAAQFRAGLAFLHGQSGALETGAMLADIAATVIAAVLRLAQRDVRRLHGVLPGEADQRMLIVGYGSLGGSELGFNSDLDLVFLHDGLCLGQQSSGPRKVDGQHYQRRVAQRVLHLLTALTRAGRLYEVDIRLTADGGKGLLVSSLSAYADYQQRRAGIWEQQALVRARAIAGDDALAEQFRQVRAQVLCAPRDARCVASQLSEIRTRWRAGRDRSNAQVFDLKHGPGGLVDMQFILNSQVLAHASAYPGLVTTDSGAALTESLHKHGLLADADARTLRDAHAAVLDHSLRCTLDRHARVMARPTPVDELAQAVAAIARSLGLTGTPLG